MKNVLIVLLAVLAGLVAGEVQGARASVRPVSIAVEPNGSLWVVGDNHEVWKRVDGRWQKMPGWLTHLAIGAKGAIWGIGAGADWGGGKEILFWNGRNWVPVAGRATRIAVEGDGTPWVVNSATQIFRRERNTWKQNRTALAREIAANGPFVWVIGLDGSPGHYGVYEWKGGRWHKLAGFSAGRIAVSPLGTPYMPNRANHIWTPSGALPWAGKQVVHTGPFAGYMIGAKDKIHRWDTTTNTCKPVPDPDWGSRWSAPLGVTQHFAEGHASYTIDVRMEKSIVHLHLHGRHKGRDKDETNYAVKLRLTNEWNKTLWVSPQETLAVKGRLDAPDNNEHLYKVYEIPTHLLLKVRKGWVEGHRVRGSNLEKVGKALADLDAIRLEILRRKIGKPLIPAYFAVRKHVQEKNRGRKAIRLTKDDFFYKVIHPSLGRQIDLTRIDLYFDAYVPDDAPAITFGNSVYIKASYKPKDAKLAGLVGHEMTHSAQVARCGGEVRFAERYLGEGLLAWVTKGGGWAGAHDNNDLEREASRIEKAVSDRAEKEQ